MSMRVCLFSLALSAVFAVLAEPVKVVPATGTVGGGGYNEPEKGVRKTAAKPAEGVSGAPPINDGRPAYLAQPWESAAARDAAIADYAVFVDGRKIPLYTADVDCAEWESEYYFGSFELAHPVEVRVKSSRPLDKVEILPAKYGIAAKRIAADEIAFEATAPFRISVERDRRVKPLLLFADPPEKDVPRPGAPNVVWYGPGYHLVGRIPLRSNQTLYLALGAVVTGCVEARGTNIVVRGRGILDQRAYARFGGPGTLGLDFRGCRGVKIEGITFRNPCNWVISAFDCEDMLVENFKLCGGRMINDDATDPCNCRRLTIRDSFFRAADDIFAVKGNLPKGAPQTPCEDILIENCEAWTDAANVFRIGFECNAEAFRRITARNVDVLHYSKTFRPADHTWANCIFYLQAANDMPIEGVLFEHIRVHASDGPCVMISARSMVTGCLSIPYTTAGTLSGVTFRDVSVSGRGDFRGPILVRGFSAERKVSGVTIENMTYFGRRLTRNSPEIAVGPFAEGVAVK